MQYSAVLDCYALIYILLLTCGRVKDRLGSLFESIILLWVWELTQPTPLLLHYYYYYTYYYYYYYTTTTTD